MVAAAEFPVTLRLRDRLERSRVHDATERFGARECIGALKNPMDDLWGSASASAHRKSCNTVWVSASVHWHVEKAHGWFVGVRECIGPSQVLQHGLESASVHWHVEKAYGWFVAVRECIGTSKVLLHLLCVRECALARRKGPRMVCGGPRVH